MKLPLRRLGWVIVAVFCIASNTAYAVSSSHKPTEKLHKLPGSSSSLLMPEFLDSAPADTTVSCVDDVPAPVTLRVANANNDTISVLAVDDPMAGTLSVCTGGEIMRIWSYTDPDNGTMIADTMIITVLPDTTGIPYVPPITIFTGDCDDDFNLWVNDRITEITAAAGMFNGCADFQSVNYVGPAAPASACGALDAVFTIEDVCGNLTDVTYMYNTVDNEAPAIVGVVDGLEIIVSCTDPIPPVPVVTVTDNCTMNLEATFTEVNFYVPDSTSCQAYSYNILRTWMVTDSCRNTTMVRQTIIVRDNLGPTFNEPSDITILCSQDPLDLTITGNVSNVADNCSSIFQTTFMDEETPSGNCGEEYTIRRQWTVRDACNNFTVKIQNISVQDNLPPVFMLPADITVDCSQAGDMDVTGQLSDVTDNCDDSPTVTFSDLITPGINGCENEYTIRRTWSVEDNCGNISGADQIITVEDRQDPIFADVPANLTVTCTDTSDLPQLFAEWIASYAGATAEDNCTLEEDLVWAVYEAGTAIPATYPSLMCGIREDTIMQKWVDVVVTDECGRSNLRQVAFTVIDRDAPEISNCPESRTVTTDAGQCEATVSLGAASITDACSEGAGNENIALTLPITSAAGPGQLGDVPVDPITFNLMLAGPLPVVATGPAQLRIRLTNADAEGAEEYFLVYGEDNSLLGRTKRTAVQCANSDTLLTVSQTQINSWATDGQITVRLEPFIPGNLPGRFAVNAICLPGGSATAELSFSTNRISPQQFAYRVDGGMPVVAVPGSSPTASLGLGNHLITYIATDCGGNRDSCSFSIRVEDLEAPDLICPPDRTIFLSPDSCSATILLDLPLGINDNCEAYQVQTQTSPADTASALLQFYYDPNLTAYQALEKIYIFTGLTANAYGNAQLTVSYQGDFNSPGAFFTIYGDDDQLLGQSVVGSADCSMPGQLVVSIPAATFNDWASDGVIAIRLSPNDISVPPGVPGDGINPCDPAMVSGDGDDDGETYVFMTFSYNTLSLEYFTEGETSTPPTPMPQPSQQVYITFANGVSEVGYSASDAAGNLDRCRYQVTIADTTPPNAFCQPTTIFIDPSGADVESIAAEVIDDGSFDNCGEIELLLSPNTFNCSQVGLQVPVTLTATDEAGNSGQCNTLVTVAPLGPEPTANSGVCGGDTLFLFANPPQAFGNIVYTYRWYNPANILFSTSQNPVIPNISPSAEGPYRVEIRGLTGCTAEGVVNVSIEDLPMLPSIAAPASACADAPLLLTTPVIPSGSNVQFHWYEGIAPGGLLLGSTATPEFTVSANNMAGTRRFYLTAEANGCVSGPSTVTEVIVYDRPVASVGFTDTLVCAQTELQLLANPVSGATYTWSGPNFSSNQQFPLIGPLGIVNQGIYELVVSRGACVSAPDSVQVLVKPRPAQPMLTTIPAVCEGSDVTFTTTTTDASSWHWQGPGNQQFVTNEPSYTASQVSLGQSGPWRLFVRANGCDSELSVPTSLVVNPNPVAGAQASPNPVCTGGTVMLQGNSSINGSGYQWTGPGNYFANVASPVISNVQTSQSGNYQLVVTSQEGCRDTTVASLSVVQGVAITGISDNVPDCTQENVTVVITSSVFPPNQTGYTYIWSFNGQVISNAPNLTIPNASAVNAGLYTLEVLSGQGCSSGQQTHLLDLNFTPAQPAQPTEISNRTTFCEGESIILTTTNYNSPGVQYYWTTPGNNVVTTSTNTLEISSATVQNGGLYTVYVVLGGCSSAISIPRSIQVNQVPQLMLSSNSPVCQGDVLSLMATQYPGAVYSWSGPGGFSASISNPIIPNANAMFNAGRYWVTASRNGCESDTISVEVEVLERPAAPLIISNSPICLADEDAQVELQIAPTSQQAGALYRWFGPDGFTPLATASTDSVLVLNNLLPYSTGGSFPFYARTSVNGCVSALSQPTVVQFDVVPPNAAVAGMDTTICASQYTLRAIAPSVGSGRWSLAGATDPATVIIANPDQPGSIVTGLSIAGGPYVLRWTLSNGACRDYSADEVTITVAPAEQANAGEDIIACADEIINLNATPPALAGSTGQWTQDFGQTAFGVVIEQPGNPSTLISGLVPNNIFTFTWEVSSGCGLSVDRVRVIIVDPMPVAGADQSICADEPTAALQAAQPGLGSSGAWSSPDSTLVFTSASSPATSVRNLKPGVNLLVWTVDGGVCGADSRDTLLITYNKPPIAIADTITVPFGRTVELMPLDNDTIYGVVTLLAGTTPDRGTVSYQGSSIRYTPPANFLGETSFSYQLAAPGCPTATGQVFVQIGEDAGCKPPSIITPNDDGINDFFVVPCLLDTERYPNSQVIIFNRWGDEVFRSGKPYMSNWGAKYDGTDLPADTYFFVVELGDGSSPVSGYVMIQR